jgi:hypothetical protein
MDTFTPVRGIQGNQLKLMQPTLYLFNVYNDAPGWLSHSGVQQIAQYIGAEAVPAVELDPTDAPPRWRRGRPLPTGKSCPVALPPRVLWFALCSPPRSATGVRLDSRSSIAPTPTEANETMSARAQRKAESEQRRREWRIRWAEIGVAAARAGNSLELIAADAERIAVASPQRKAEVKQALIEFRGAVERAIAQTQ